MHLSYPKLQHGFYRNTGAVAASRNLLGKVLCTHVNGMLTSGIIVETEAYNGATDRASHAYNDRRTRRTETMFQEGGCAYVYLCYGIHHLFNVVVGEADNPIAVLIRAIEPLDGIEAMQERAKLKRSVQGIPSGPGLLTKLLGIDMDMNSEDLTGQKVWIEDRGIAVAPEQIIAGPRIGVAYAKEDALLPYRFYIRGNQYVSKAKANY